MYCILNDKNNTLKNIYMIIWYRVQHRKIIYFDLSKLTKCSKGKKIDQLII